MRFVFRSAAIISVPILLSTSAFAQAPSEGREILVEHYVAVYTADSTENILRGAVWGDTLAQHELSNRLTAGRGIERNPTEAAKWYSRAASRGFPGAASVDQLPNLPILARVADTANTSSPPVAGFTAAREADSLRVTLDASSSQSPTTIDHFVWAIRTDAGDLIPNQPASAPDTSFHVDHPGQYYITLAVVDDQGRIDHITNTLDVLEPTPPSPEAPELLTPEADAVVFAEEELVFSWLHQTDEILSYSLEIHESIDVVDSLISASIPSASCFEGTCSLSIVFADVPVGQLYWRVQAHGIAGSSDWSHSTLIVEVPPLLAPVALSPSTGSQLSNTSTVTFAWQPVDHATQYTLELINPITDASPDTTATIPAGSCDGTQCSISIDLNPTDLGDYLWQVRAEHTFSVSPWTQTAIVIQPLANLLPDPPVPLHPNIDATVAQGAEVTFTWQADSDADAWHLELIDGVKQSSVTIASAVAANTLCDDLTCSLSHTIDLPAGDSHGWRLRASNAYGGSTWSFRGLSVQPSTQGLPGEFVLISPEPEAQLVQNGDITFSWSTSAFADSYDLAVIDGSSNETVLAAHVLSTDACDDENCMYTSSPQLTLSDQHSWQVSASNAQGSTDWRSAVFQVLEAPRELATALVVIAPLAGTPVFAGENTRFEWQHDPDALTYDFYLIGAGGEPGVPGFIETLLPENHCSDGLCSFEHVVNLGPGDLGSWHVRALYADLDSESTNTPLTVQATGVASVNVSMEATNVSGGGFQMDVTISEDGSTVYASTDVSGIFRSNDGGASYTAQNHGLESIQVASLALTPDNERILYAGTGDKGNSGGLFRSTDAGETWTVTNSGRSARFAGNHTANEDPLPNGHPRSNGDLIVVSPGPDPDHFDDDIVIAGSYRDGVRIFGAGGETELAAVNTDGLVRSLAHHSNHAGIVYAAIHFADSERNGIYRIDYSNVNEPVSTLVYATTQPEGLAMLSNGHVYAAIGRAGIVKFDGENWRLHNNALSIDNARRPWTAVTGYVADGQDIVYIGVNNRGGDAAGENYSTVWRSDDSGDTWIPLVDVEHNVSDIIYGQSHAWWFRTDAFQQAGLGRKNSIVSAIDVARGPSANDPSDDLVYVSGRGGIWKSTDGGGNWAPAVNNLQATTNRGVAVNQNTPGQVALANTDYVILETRNGFSGDDVTRDRPSGAESRAYDAIFDTVSNQIIVGVGDRDSNTPGGGEVFIKSAEALGNPSGSNWLNTGLASATQSNNGRVRAVAYGYHDGATATTQTVLAAVEGEGVFRLHEGQWNQSTGVSIGDTDRSKFLWPDNENSGLVYLIDLSSGLYRSTDGGRSWVNMWPNMSLRNNDFYNTGYLAAQNQDPETLYVSIQGDSGSPIGTGFRVFRLRDAGTRIFNSPDSPEVSEIQFHSVNERIQRPGPLVMDPDNRLWLTEQQDSRQGVDAGLFVMENPGTDTTFTEVSGEDYRDAVVSPIGIDVSSDGYIYISQNGGGIVKIAISVP